MSKVKKILAFTAVSAAVTTAVNHFIFSRAQNGLETDKSVKVFKWKHGRVRYTARGQGKPLLLIHGVGRGRSGREWEAAARMLARKRRVYIIDLLGFGQSDTPALDYSAYLYITLINDFVRRVIRRKTAVAAEGKSAAYAVMACAFSPESYEKIIMVSPQGIDTPPPRRRFKDGLLRTLLDIPVLGTALYNAAVSRAAMKKYAYPFKPQAASAGRDMRLYEQAHAGGPNARYVLRSMAAGFLDADIRRALTQIKKPLMVIGGPLGEVKRLCPSAEAVRKIHSYLPYWQEPALFYRVCQPFLS